MTKGLTFKEFVPCSTYNLQTLVNLGIFDLPTSVGITGQELSTFDDNEKYQAFLREFSESSTGELSQDKKFAVVALVQAYNEHPTDYKLESFIVDSGLVTKLGEANVQVPKDKKALFGDNFSKLVEYNAALQRPILTEEDGASSEFREALYEWHEHLKPETVTSFREYINRAKKGDSLAAVWAVGAYIGEKIQAGRASKRVAPEIVDLVRPVVEEKLTDELANLLRQAAKARLADKLPRSKDEYKELSLLADNAWLVFENYYRISQFRDQFRDQISALVDLYSGDRWSKEARSYAQRMKEFLRG